MAVPWPVAATTLESGPRDFGTNTGARALKCFNIRVNAAQAELNVRVPHEATNGYEHRFQNYIGSSTSRELQVWAANS
jgi:hypothetical protein